MNRTITLLVFLISLNGLATDLNCGTAYQDGTYGVQHADKALEASNVDQLKQYAKRSKEAQERVLAATNKCGCTEANNSSFKAIEKLDKALVEEKYDMVRYYVKNSLSDSKSVLLALDLCADSASYFAVDTSTNELSLQEEELLAQQQQLLEKQKQIEEQLRLQKELQQKIQQQKQEKYTIQQELRTEAEANLKNLENNIRSILEQMNCDVSTQFIASDYHRTDSELESESLNATYSFYSSQAQSMARELINILTSCRKKE